MYARLARQIPASTATIAARGAKGNPAVAVMQRPPRPGPYAQRLQRGCE